MSAMQRRRRWKWREPPALLTLEECATKLGITPQRVQQLERQALRKLRAALEERGFHLEDLL